MCPLSLSMTRIVLLFSSKMGLPMFCFLHRKYRCQLIKWIRFDWAPIIEVLIHPPTWRAAAQPGMLIYCLIFRAEDHWLLDMEKESIYGNIWRSVVFYSSKLLWSFFSKINRENSKSSSKSVDVIFHNFFCCLVCLVNTFCIKVDFPHYSSSTSRRRRFLLCMGRCFDNPGRD